MPGDRVFAVVIGVLVGHVTVLHGGGAVDAGVVGLFVAVPTWLLVDHLRNRRG